MEGAIQAAGYWITGSKRLVSSVIHKCVTCCKLQGRMENQKMADLPVDRLTSELPFTTVGLDVFGPWSIMTRGGGADSKHWVVLFTCMSTRAVHIELIETMSTDSFINALWRFFSIRGPAKLLRSDRGTNFVGACKQLDINTDDQQSGNTFMSEGVVIMNSRPLVSVSDPDMPAVLTSVMLLTQKMSAILVST